jgi:hypothetical protein
VFREIYAVKLQRAELAFVAFNRLRVASLKLYLLKVSIGKFVGGIGGREHAKKTHCTKHLCGVLI